MRAVLSRVSRASITIDGEFGGSIDKGFLVLLGIGSEDKESDAVYLAKKCAEMRIFEDENEKMNLGLSDVPGAYPGKPWTNSDSAKKRSKRLISLNRGNAGFSGKNRRFRGDEACPRK